MPELPEVETVRRGLEPVMAGAEFGEIALRRANLRFPFPTDFAQRLKGQKVMAVRRRAKYLLIDLSGGESLIIHLGMTGRFRLGHEKGEAPLTVMYYEGSDLPAHDHVVFELIREGARSSLIYNDARRFGFMDISLTDELESHPYFAHLGLEPLSSALSGETLLERLKGAKTPMKSALLDQRRIAGLGNIYVCEALFRVGVSPFESASSWASRALQNPHMADDLALAIRQTLTRALEVGGSTLRDYRGVDGASGGFQDEFLVYGREGAPCTTCLTPISRMVQAGRSSFFCPTCQPHQAKAAKRRKGG